MPATMTVFLFALWTQAPESPPPPAPWSPERLIDFERALDLRGRSEWRVAAAGAPATPILARPLPASALRAQER